MNENSVSYANEKERSIVQVSFGKKMTDFRLIIEVIDCGAQPEMTFARSLMHGLGLKTIRKIFYNIDLAEQTNDPKLFKKLKNDIWEFRTTFAGLQIRLLAFWDKTNNKKTLVIATHGFLKKVDKVPANEIDRAVRLRDKYFNNKQKG